MRYTSRSGRDTVLKPGRLLAGTLFLLLSFFAVFFAINAYTPVIQYYGGNPATVIGNQTAFPILWRRFKSDIEASLVNAIAAKEPPLKSELPEVKVFAEWTALASLNHEILRYHTGEYEAKPKIRAVYQLPEGGSTRIRLGYRGTNTSHHYFWKPSWQIRFRDKPINGFSRQNLVNPEDAVGLRNWLSMALAEKWDQVNNRESFCRMFLNGRYLGVYTTIHPYGEELLKHEGWPDGPIFRLDHGSGPLFKRRFLRFWEPSHWDLINADEQTAIRTLYRFIAPLMRRSPEDFSNVLHRENTARYMALLCHGGSNHVDVHNIVVYFDRSRGLFSPLLIDVNGYGFAASSIERPFVFIGNDIFHSFLERPENLKAYVDATWELINGFGSVEETLRTLDEQWQVMKADVVAEADLSEAGFYTGNLDRTHFPVTKVEENVERVREFVRKRQAFVRDYLTSDQVILLGVAQDRFQLAVIGASGVKAIPTDGTPEMELLPTLAKQKEAEKEKAQRTARTYAIYALSGKPGDYRFLHRLTGETVVPTSEPQMGNELQKDHGLHPWNIPPKQPLVLKGDLELTKDLEAPNLVVEPGTVLRMQAGTSILVRGDISFKGTVDQPISIIPADPNQSWGTIASIDGNVEISHTKIRGGGGAEISGVSFEGALSLHHCQASIVSSSFEDGLLSLLGSARQPSKTTIADSEFENAAIYNRHSELSQEGVSQQGGLFERLVLEPSQEQEIKSNEASPSDAQAWMPKIKLTPETYTNEGGLLQRYSDKNLPLNGIRLKFKKDPNAAGPRELEFWPGTTEALRSLWLPEVLAAQMGVVTAKTEPVALSGRLLLRSIAPSESLCIGQGLLPGTFYLPKSGLWSPVSSEWDAVGASTHDFIALQQLFSLLRGNDESNRIQEVVSAEDMARWNAVCRLTGADRNRLAGFYLSTYEGLLKPLVSGPRALAVEPSSETKLFMDQVWAKLEADPSWVARRDSLSAELKRVYPDETLEKLLGGSGEIPKFEPEISTDKGVKTDLVLGPGVVGITEDLFVSGDQRLVVKPGTRLVLSPNVGLYSRGPVIMDGNAEQPIEIISSSPAPFACVGIVGPGTAGSRFRYVNVKNGSIGSLGGVRFKGMFNVYHCPQVSFNHCRFGTNQVGDDSVNVAVSTATFEDCSWEKARADALDLDLCQAKVERCTFSESANDGLDISTSIVTASNCSFVKSGDKGVSVGEDSRIEMFDSTFQACEIGVQVKDNSQALVRAGIFRENGVDVDCYRKKSIFVNGGTARLEGCTFQGKRKVSADRYSKVE